MPFCKIKAKTMFFAFVVTFSLYLSCSAKRVEFFDQRCTQAKEVVVRLLQILSNYDIKDINTRKYIEDFFRSEDDIDIFVASLTYKVRDKKAFYGSIENFSILSSYYDENSKGCKFEVYVRLKKKYPLDDIRFSYYLTLFEEDGRWFVEPPQYIGDIKRREYKGGGEGIMESIREY